MALCFNEDTWNEVRVSKMEWRRDASVNETCPKRQGSLVLDFRDCNWDMLIRGSVPFTHPSQSP